MDLQQINQLTRESVARLTSEAYLEAFNSPDTGKQFAEKINTLENTPRAATGRPRGNVRGEESSAVTPTPGFDPSFDDQPNQPAAAVPAQPAAATSAQPAAASAAVDESLPELVHEYQPVDRNGRPVGHKQSFKYRTQAELIEKLTKAHSDASAHIRELSRNRRLEEIASAGPTAKNVMPSTEVPKTMEELAKELLEQRQANYLLSVREALNTFRLSNKEWAKYSGDPENAKSLVLAISRAGDDPSSVESYTRAFAAMKDLLQPVVVAEPASTPAPAPAPVVAAPAVRTAPSAGIATGFSNADSTSDDLFVEPTKVAGVKIVMPDGKTQVMTLAAYDRLGTDVQKRILRNAANANAVESLYLAEDAAKKLRR